MSLDLRVWTNLEAHGVTQAHLEMLLRALETQRNGSLAWHYAHGALTQCDLRLVLPSGSYDISKATESVLDGMPCYGKGANP
jgi:hypothetical protein